ncbi:MAG TPA: sigma 54-interacting transcriptional regulator [Thermoanaerobaculia bacterium]|nr:sigma 54-interacting transcriptional regulator [Thermoanaerobaculia bacterium]
MPSREQDHPGQRPRLVAVAGPLTGSVFSLSGEDLTIGRQAGCAVQLRDLEVSRRHCTVARDAGIAGAAGGFVVRDLGSRHGTFVNGLPVAERTLEEGDAIGAGSSLLLFLVGEEPLGERSAVQLEDGALSAETSVQLAPRDSAYLRPAMPPVPSGSPTTPEASSRLLRDLSLLVRIGALLQALPAVEPLCRRLLGLLLEAVPAERAAVLLLDREDGAPTVAYTLERRSGSARPFPVSRTVVARVLGERTGLLANDVLRTPELGEAASVRAARLRSLLAVPVLHLDRALGLLYLDSPETGGPVRFDRGHLELATAVAGLAAPALANARRLEQLEAERRATAAGVLGGGLVGESPRLVAVRNFLARVAPTDSTVLLRGESGTGKELAARAIHQAGPRAGGPFIAINCATLSETLFESELFGHEKGAFTGAVAQKIGKFEAADGGTLFLDEVGEIPIHLQARLLRALQERELERVGNTRTIKVDVRVIAATNRDLEAGVAAGSFRADLYYRLNVLALELPPLRERREDIPLLARHFAARLGPRLGRPAAAFTPEALDGLLRYSWPGNVRELANAVERALVLGEGDGLRPEDLPEAVIEAGGKRSSGPVAPYHEAVLRLKEELVLGAIEQAGGNVTRAAELLGIHPNYLHRLIKNLGLRPRLSPPAVL